MNPNEKNEFDRQLADKFKDFKPNVPAGLWDRIATQLDAQQSHPVIPLKKRRFTTRWMSVAAAILMVCGMVYWYNRPIPVTYLQGRVATHEEVASDPDGIDVTAKAPTPEPIPEVEPLDIAQLKRVFTKKNRQRTITTAVQPKNLPAESTEIQQLTAHETASPKDTPTAPIHAAETQPTEQAFPAEAVAAVPDIQPLVVLEEEEETLLAAENTGRQPFGISNILNYVVGTVDQREEKLVTFSNDDEGSLKLDFNFGLAKNRKKKIK